MSFFGPQSRYGWCKFCPCFIPRCWFTFIEVLFPMLYQNVHLTCTPCSTSFFLQLFLFLFIFFANISSIILSIWHRFASCKIPRCNIWSVRYMCGTTVCLVESAFFKRWWSYKFMTCMKVLQTFWCSVRKPMLNIWDQAFQINMLSSEILTKYSFHITNHIVYLSNDLQLS